MWGIRFVPYSMKLAVYVDATQPTTTRVETGITHRNEEK